MGKEHTSQKGPLVISFLNLISEGVQKGSWLGRRERGIEAYSLRYVEILSDTRTTPGAFFNARYVSR